jgi:hypothetical protein
MRKFFISPPKGCWYRPSSCGLGDENSKRGEIKVKCISAEKCAQ